MKKKPGNENERTKENVDFFSAQVFDYEKSEKQKGKFSTIAVKTRAVGWNAVTVERMRWSHDDHRQYEGIPGGCQGYCYRSPHVLGSHEEDGVGCLVIIYRTTRSKQQIMAAVGQKCFEGEGTSRARSPEPSFQNKSRSGNIPNRLLTRQICPSHISRDKNMAQW